MSTFVPYRTCWSLLLTELAIRLRNKPTYDKLQVLIINKDVRKPLAHKNGNDNPIWSWNDSHIHTFQKVFFKLHTHIWVKEIITMDFFQNV